MEKPKVLKCTLKVLENQSTFEMYLSTSTSTDDFPEMYLSTFQVLYKLYLSTKYSCPALVVMFVLVNRDGWKYEDMKTKLTRSPRTHHCRSARGVSSAMC